MGMSLEVSDFKNIFNHPLSVFAGSFGQLLLLPLLAISIITLWPYEIDSTLKVGLIILAACPGGVGSNVVAFLAGGNTALSVTLTLISSFSAVLTVPFLVNYGLSHYATGYDYIPLPLLATSLKIAAITLLPIGMGMLSKKKYPGFTEKFSKIVQKVSIALLMLLVAGVLYKEKRILVELTKQAGALGTTLCVLGLLMGFIIGKLFKLDPKHGKTIAIEIGLQNIFLSIVIISNFIEQPAFLPIPAVYSPITMLASLIIVLASGNFKKPN